MINAIKRWFNIKPNDWKEIWFDYGEWDLTVFDDFREWKESKQCTYCIQRSESRNKIRLLVGGHQPRHHHMYNTAMQKYIEFINA